MDKLVKGNAVDDAWLGIDTTQEIDISDHPLFMREQFFLDNPGIAETHCLRQIDYVGWTAHKILGLKLHPFQMVVQQELLNHSFPMFVGARGCSKTFSLAVFSLLTAILNPGYKVVVAGAAFRQSKAIFQYATQILYNSSVLRSMCGKNWKVKEDPDRLTMHLNDSTITAIPIGDGEKIRGLRSNCTVVDEFKSHNPRIVEEVLFGFGSVKADPVNAVIQQARAEKLRKSGINVGKYETKQVWKNKCVISGTADYYFNHFYDYWQRYKKIIKSKGDKKVLEEIFQGEIPEAFDWRDYSIIRIPYSSLPPGFMDAAIVARAKAQMPKALYLKEYEAVFVEDSDGFFSRKRIESAVANEKNIADDKWVDYCPSIFEAIMAGHSGCQYVIGIDPAAKDDNFAIIVLEIYPEHQRVVHCWVTNESDFIRRKKAGLTDSESYFSFCAKKIHELVEVFPTSYVGIDEQGGGFPLMEALRTVPGKKPMVKYIDWDKPAITDDIDGNHIIYPINFNSATWTSEANWGLKKDIEGRRLLFPNYDTLTAELSIATDSMKRAEFKAANGGKQLLIVDTLEECADNIEFLKDELTTITYTRTGISAREHWDVPSIKTGKRSITDGKKDRYSALLIANYLARMARELLEERVHFSPKAMSGGLVRDFKNADSNEPAYIAPAWFFQGSDPF